jgi:hypothetical protein
MTWWQFNETVEGFVRSKTNGQEDGLSAIEEDQLGALLNAPL